MVMPKTKPQHDAPLYFPTVASTAYEPGDLVYDNGSGAILPASSQADQSSESANQVLLATNFVGVCAGKKLASDTTTGERAVIVNQDLELTCVSSTFDIGDYVGGDEDSSGTALENQQVKKVSAIANTIGIVMKSYSVATTKVWVRPITKYGHGKDPS